MIIPPWVVKEKIEISLCSFHVQAAAIGTTACDIHTPSALAPSGLIGGAPRPTAHQDP